MHDAWLILKDVVAFFRRPKLKIVRFDTAKDLRVFEYYDTGWVRKFANLYIENTKTQIATNCNAVLKPVSIPPNVTHLERQYNLHWSDVGYSMRTVGAQPIDIEKSQKRLDVVFSQKGQQIPGCWIAIPFALSQTQPKQNQAYLPPGEYEIEVVIDCENGRGDRCRYRIVSPEEWLDLSMVEMKD